MPYTLAELAEKIDAIEKKQNEMDIKWAVINTKLNGILWGVATIGAAVIGVLVKLIVS